jgi:hypothetical protein
MRTVVGAMLVLMATGCPLSTGTKEGTEAGGGGGGGQPSGATCDARDAVFSIGPISDDGNGACTGSVMVEGLDSCVVLKAKVTGSGETPSGATLRVERGSGSSPAIADMRTIMGANPWSWEGNQLNCSTLGCGNGGYDVKIVAPDCGLIGLVDLTLKVD